MPLPVPHKLFWSATVYDAESRSQIQTDQGKAALRSLFALKDVSGSAVDLYFGPSAPSGQEGDGSRQCREKDGSCTSASTDPTCRRSTDSGNLRISNGRNECGCPAPLQSDRIAER
jgi:hypothetical protein